MPACSRTTYILLGLLPALGGIFGIHNLVSGRVALGVTQLILSFVTIGGPFGLVFGVVIAPPCCCIGVPAWLALFVWTVVEVVTVTRDARGVEMN